METIDQIKERLQQMLKPSRLAHSYGVSEEAERLARLYNADVEKASYAGLAHDICKNMPQEMQLQWIERSGIIHDGAFYTQPPIWHGFAGAQYLKETCGVLDEEILQAVRYHTTGRANMALLEKIIFVADLTEKTRDYPDLEVVRTLADQSLDQAIFYIIRYTLGKLLSQSTPFCKDCVEAYNQLVLTQIGKNL